jgi:hypothetical protein
VKKTVARICPSLALALLAIGACACGNQENPPDRMRKCVTDNGREVCDPSLVELLVRPELYDGALVSVIGLLTTDFEHTALFPSREAMDWLRLRSAAWVQMDAEVRKRFAHLNERYVVVQARFRMGPAGHFGEASGLLYDVESIHPITSYSYIKQNPPKFPRQ